MNRTPNENVVQDAATDQQEVQSNFMARITEKCSAYRAATTKEREARKQLRSAMAAEFGKSVEDIEKIFDDAVPR